MAGAVVESSVVAPDIVRKSDTFDQVVIWYGWPRLNLKR
jgi:hypothetical protein